MNTPITSENYCVDRNCGLDLFRLYSMFSVVVLHVLGHGGVLGAASGSSYVVVWLLRTVFLVAVNCYALLSGFVGFAQKEKPTRYGKYFMLWLQVLCYSAGIALLVQLMTNDLSIKQLIKACLPVTTSQYWYFTAYSGVFFLSPWCNRLVRRCSLKETASLLVILLLSLIYISATGALFDPFKLSGGYSFVWLMVLYLLGACLRKLNVAVLLKWWQCGVIAVSLMLLSCSVKIAFPSHDILTSYTSFTTVGASIALLVLFAKFPVKGAVARVIRWCSPCAFGVYLIHDHPAIRSAFMTGRFAGIAEKPLWLIPSLVLAVALGIFLICLCADLCRRLLFEICKIPQLCQWLEKKIRRLGETVLGMYKAK